MYFVTIIDGDHWRRRELPKMLWLQRMLKVVSFISIPLQAVCFTRSLTQWISYSLVTTSKMERVSWLLVKEKRLKSTMNRLVNSLKRLRAVVVVCQVTQIVFSAPSLSVKTLTWSSQAAGIRTWRFGTSVLHSAFAVLSDLTSLVTQLMSMMVSSWQASIHKLANCSYGTWDQVTWQKTFPSTRSYPQPHLYNSIRLNSKRTPMIWFLPVVQDQMRSKFSMEIVSSSHAIAFTIFQEPVTQLTSATAEKCLPSVAVTASCVSSMSRRNVERRIDILQLYSGRDITHSICLVKTLQNAI